MSPLKMGLGGIALVVGLAGLAAQSAGPYDRIGQPITPWVEGTLDIHQIATGQGNSAFVVMPDGTTLLIDAGGPAEAIARYIDHALPSTAPRRIDYAVITHFHADHVGALAELGRRLTVRQIIGRVADPARGADAVRVGRNDQIVPVVDRSRARDFEVRAVAANGEVWTGRGVDTEQHFPKPAPPDPDLPWENISSIGVKIRYGRFDFFSGGDMYGIPDPGMPSWVDIETPVARALGPTDVHVVNMHGSISVENAAFLMTLRSRVIIVPSWSETHPSADVLKRAMAPRAYPGPRDVFATTLREPTKRAIGARADQLAGVGHIVVRVSKDGATYRVVVVDASTESLRVKETKGPYESF